MYPRLGTPALNDTSRVCDDQRKINQLRFSIGWHRSASTSKDFFFILTRKNIAKLLPKILLSNFFELSKNLFEKKYFAIVSTKNFE